MHISEYSFYRLYQAEEERLNRELEIRRIASERILEGSVPPSRRTGFFRRDRGRSPRLAPNRAH